MFPSFLQGFLTTSDVSKEKAPVVFAKLDIVQQSCLLARYKFLTMFYKNTLGCGIKDPSIESFDYWLDKAITVLCASSASNVKSMFNCLSSPTKIGFIDLAFFRTLMTNGDVPCKISQEAYVPMLAWLAQSTKNTLPTAQCNCELMVPVGIYQRQIVWHNLAIGEFSIDNTIHTGPGVKKHWSQYLSGFSPIDNNVDHILIAASYYSKGIWNSGPIFRASADFFNDKCVTVTQQIPDTGCLKLLDGSNVGNEVAFLENAAQKKFGVHNKGYINFLLQRFFERPTATRIMRNFVFPDGLPNHDMVTTEGISLLGGSPLLKPGMVLDVTKNSIGPFYHGMRRKDVYRIFGKMLPFLQSKQKQESASFFSRVFGFVFDASGKCIYIKVNDDGYKKPPCPVILRYKGKNLFRDVKYLDMVREDYDENNKTFDANKVKQDYVTVDKRMFFTARDADIPTTSKADSPITSTQGVDSITITYNKMYGPHKNGDTYTGESLSSSNISIHEDRVDILGMLGNLNELPSFGIFYAQDAPADDDLLADSDIEIDENEDKESENNMNEDEELEEEVDEDLDDPDMDMDEEGGDQSDSGESGEGASEEPVEAEPETVEGHDDLQTSLTEILGFEIKRAQDPTIETILFKRMLESRITEILGSDKYGLEKEQVQALLYFKQHLLYLVDLTTCLSILRSIFAKKTKSILKL